MEKFVKMDLFNKLSKKPQFTMTDVVSLDDGTYKSAFDFIRYLMEMDVLDKTNDSTFKITKVEGRLNKFFEKIRVTKEEMDSFENSDPYARIWEDEEPLLSEPVGNFGIEVTNADNEKILVLVHKFDTPLTIIKKAALQFKDEKPQFFGCDTEIIEKDLIDPYESSVKVIFGPDSVKSLNLDIPVYNQLLPHKMKAVFLKKAYLNVVIVPKEEKKTKFYIRRGNHIRFGFYPQSIVDNEYITDILCEMAKNLPFNSKITPWKSYGYYSGDESNNPTDDFDFMWYTDIELYGNKYRGVYFTENRPYCSYFNREKTFSTQAENGYKPGEMYWFLYEPLDWQILEEKDEKALLLCDRIIDAQPYRNVLLNASRYVKYPYKLTPVEKYENSWKFSDIRSWLNEDFYNTAFISFEKDIISEEKIITPFEDEYCEKTEDNVFLLSLDEVSDCRYGFKEDSGEYDRRRMKSGTDYAKCQGLSSCLWMLRGMIYGNNSSFANVLDCGCISSQTVDNTDFGIVPSVVINL